MDTSDPLFVTETEMMTPIKRMRLHPNIRGAGLLYSAGMGDDLLYGDGAKLDKAKAFFGDIGRTIKRNASKAFKWAKQNVVPVAAKAGKALAREAVQHVASNLGNYIQAARDGGIQGVLAEAKMAVPDVLTNSLSTFIEGDDDADGIEEADSSLAGNGIKKISKAQLRTLIAQLAPYFDSIAQPIHDKLDHIQQLSEAIATEADDDTLNYHLDQIKRLNGAVIEETDDVRKLLASLLDEIVGQVLRVMHIQQIDYGVNLDIENESGGFLNLLGLIGTAAKGISEGVAQLVGQKDPAAANIIRTVGGTIGGIFGGGSSPWLDELQRHRNETLNMATMFGNGSECKDFCASVRSSRQFSRGGYNRQGYSPMFPGVSYCCGPCHEENIWQCYSPSDSNHAKRKRLC